MIPSGADLDEPHEIYRETTGGSRAVVAISVGETASVMNLILLIAYGMSCANFTPDLDVIGEALRWLDKYGIQIPDSHSPTGIWPLVIQYAQRQPIRAYALAASHSMEDICVEISPLTLSTSLHNISESDALTMGPIFLRRLFFLHLGRRSACKQVFEKPPAQHAETASCTLANQIEVTRVWELKMADVVLHPSQENFPVEELRRMFSGIVEGRACSACIEAIRARVEKACAEWLAVKQTI
ncbi:hypothetical protein FRB96_007217 [Tulasnella sp. 330]|nr:hypothetical protein FRB96_007217 [Tulasnella sp. 330]KAG8876116.1 hypothetical protein FRB97_004436 [Tulasnella sp. 331]KAG8885634.1 hypothetical protein FRB98_001727 [Tulasnella sp. 332]